MIGGQTLAFRGPPFCEVLAARTHFFLKTLPFLEKKAMSCPSRVPGRALGGHELLFQISMNILR